MMKRAALILARGFEESEALSVADILRRAGLTCELVGLEETEVEGAHGISVRCDRILDGDVTDYDMIILPGGYGGVERMKGSEELLALLQEMNRKGRYVSALCAAPSVLAEAGLLEGKYYTAYRECDPEVSRGNYVKKPVVVDENLLTGMGPAMAYAFAYRAAKLLGGDSRAVKERMLYSHSFREEEEA